VYIYTYQHFLLFFLYNIYIGYIYIYIGSDRGCLLFGEHANQNETSKNTLVLDTYICIMYRYTPRLIIYVDTYILFFKDYRKQRAVHGPGPSSSIFRSVRHRRERFRTHFFKYFFFFFPYPSTNYSFRAMISSTCRRGTDVSSYYAPLPSRKCRSDEFLFHARAHTLSKKVLLITVFGLK